MTVFKLRTECRKDVTELLELMPPQVSLTLHLEGQWLGDDAWPPQWIPDVVATITLAPFPGHEEETTVTLADMVALCREVPDGHVMAETVRHEKDYTGERKDPKEDE